MIEFKGDKGRTSINSEQLQITDVHYVELARQVRRWININQTDDTIFPRVIYVYPQSRIFVMGNKRTPRIHAQYFKISSKFQQRVLLGDKGNSSGKRFEETNSDIETGY